MVLYLYRKAIFHLEAGMKKKAQEAWRKSAKAMTEFAIKMAGDNIHDLLLRFIVVAILTGLLALL